MGEPGEPGERNELVDAHWVGPRSFAGEPLVVPRANGDPDDEDDAFLLGMVQDAERNKSYLAIYDLRRKLAEGPVARVLVEVDGPAWITWMFLRGWRYLFHISVLLK